MIDIYIAYPHEAAYAGARQFAKSVYGQKLHAMVAGTPDLFACAHYQGQIVGCVGLYHASASKKVMLETYAPNALQNLSGSPRTDRRLLGELGTRAVRMPDEIRSRNGDVSLGLTAMMVHMAYDSGIRYLVLTSNRTARAIATALGIELDVLCEPDISHLDKEFQENWGAFFRVKQYCFGCTLTYPAKSVDALSQLMSKGVRAHLPYGDLRHAA